MFIAGEGVKMREWGKLSGLSTKPGRGPAALSWCDEATGRNRPGTVTSRVQTNVNSPSLNHHTVRLLHSSSLMLSLKYTSQPFPSRPLWWG